MLVTNVICLVDFILWSFKVPSKHKLIVTNIVVTKSVTKICAPLGAINDTLSVIGLSLIGYQFPIGKNLAKT